MRGTVRANWVALMILASALTSTLTAAETTDDGLAMLAREVQPRIRAARKAAPKSKGTVKDLKAVYKLMKPHVPNVRKRFLKRIGHNKYAMAFAGMFNELLTVGAMHGVKFREKYICWTISIAKRRLLISMPVTPRWSIKYDRGSQHVGTLTQNRPSGKPLRVIKIWRYKWNTVYSGVGGENCKKLAERIWELDRDEARAVGGKASSKVRPRKLNNDFKRAYCYEVEMLDADLNQRIRRREIYIKGKSATMSFEVTDYWTRKPGDDAVTKFQVTGDGPEWTYLIRSVRPNK